jgi:hypothetical protein
MDPFKSENGKLYEEIHSLKKLEGSYQEIFENLVRNVQLRESENSEL